jgi:hypothetical protein
LFALCKSLRHCFWREFYGHCFWKSSSNFSLWDRCWMRRSRQRTIGGYSLGHLPDFSGAKDRGPPPIFFQRPCRGQMAVLNASMIVLQLLHRDSLRHAVASVGFRHCHNASQCVRHNVRSFWSLYLSTAG